MRSPAFALLLAAAVLLPIPALADTVTYTYTGNPFTQFYGSLYSTSDFVSGEFTVAAPLVSNSPLSGVAPLSFSFSDGVHTISSTTAGVSSGFAVATDSAGNITAWIINTSQSVLLEYINTASNHGSPNPGDSGQLLQPVGNGYYSTFAYGQNQNSPGTWTETINTAAAPEPTSLTLAATGLLGLAGAVRRKLRA